MFEDDGGGVDTILGFDFWTDDGARPPGMCETTTTTSSLPTFPAVGSLPWCALAVALPEPPPRR